MAKLRRKTPKTYDPIWNLFEDGITQTALKVFLQCPEQFRLGTMYGWTPRTVSSSIEFGMAFHEIMAGVNMGEELHQAVDNYHAQRAENILANEHDKLELTLAQVEAVADHYLVYWLSRDSRNKWLAREESFRINYTSHGGYGVIPLRGQWDGIVQRSKKTYLYECKTKGRIMEETIQRGLEWDFQTNFYNTAYRIKTGKAPHGVIYDVIRQPQLRQGYRTIAEFAARIREDIAKRPEFYFIRWEVDTDQAMVNRWQNRCLDPILTRLVHWWHSVCELPYDNPWSSPLHYINTDALISAYGPCFLFDLITTGSEMAYYRREVPFPELSATV